MYDYSKLNGKIVELYGTKENFAKKLGLSMHSLSVKLNNHADFRQDEIFRAIKLLNISKTKVGDYFFEKNVQRD